MLSNTRAYVAIEYSNILHHYAQDNNYHVRDPIVTDVVDIITKFVERGVRLDKDIILGTSIFIAELAKVSDGTDEELKERIQMKTIAWCRRRFRYLGIIPRRSAKDYPRLFSETAALLIK